MNKLISTIMISEQNRDFSLIELYINFYKFSGTAVKSIKWKYYRIVHCNSIALIKIYLIIINNDNFNWSRIKWISINIIIGN